MFPRALVVPIGFVVRIRGSQRETERIQQSRPQLKELTGVYPSRGAMFSCALVMPIGIVVRMRDSQGGTVRNQYSRQQLKELTAVSFAWQYVPACAHGAN